ncbi:MAG TPA: hypothetical protein VF119_09275 [Candidatus Limnocylindrales bacterium]
MKTARSTKATKHARRAGRAAQGRRRCDDRPRLHPIEGTLERQLERRILAAFERLDMDAPWADLAPTILPVIRRVIQPYPADVTPLTITVPPGIPTGFGIDMGPAFSHVTAAMVGSWAIDSATILATALDNLRHLVADEPPLVDPLVIEGHPVLAVQGQGWGSALILLPDVLAGILGPDPRVLITPVRNTLVALPETVDADLVIDLWSVIAHGRHDELDIDPLRWTGTDVVAISDRSRRLVH